MRRDHSPRPPDRAAWLQPDLDHVPFCGRLRLAPRPEWVAIVAPRIRDGDFPGAAPSQDMHHRWCSSPRLAAHVERCGKNVICKIDASPKQIERGLSGHDVIVRPPLVTPFNTTSDLTMDEQPSTSGRTPDALGKVRGPLDFEHDVAIHRDHGRIFFQLGPGGNAASRQDGASPDEPST